MTVKPRTIDNLGVDASVRYAKDQELYEARYIEEARLIPQKTEISVAMPYVPSEFDQFFSLGKTVSWALFSPPPTYYSGDKALFSYLLIPSLGDYEKLEASSDRIESLESVLDQEKDSSSDQEKDKRERKTLAALFECIEKLNKALVLINSRRNQYQRG